MTRMLASGHDEGDHMAASIQRFDADVPVMNRAVGIVRLQRDRAGSSDAAARPLTAAIPVGRLCPPYGLLTVDIHGDGVALDDDVFGEPLVVFRRRRIEDVLHVVEAAS